MKRKSKLEKFTPIVLGVCMLTFVAACGSDDDSSSSATPQQEQTQEGIYEADLLPVPGNEDVAGTISGKARFVHIADSFTATVNVDGAPAAAHIQHVHAGRACPTEAADTNQDTQVDVSEANAVSGLVLIPLDSDISSQASGSNSSTGASYDYTQVTSFSQMLSDLRADDTNPNDIVTKLPQGEELNLEGRVVMIHGVAGDPTLPIACGVIRRLADGGVTTGGASTGGTSTGGTSTGGTSTGGTATDTTTGVSGL